VHAIGEKRGARRRQGIKEAKGDCERGGREARAEREGPNITQQREVL